MFITRFDDDNRAGGIRLAVKDCIDVTGARTTVGSPVLAEFAPVADADAACLSGARAAGVRLVGKTNLHELCFGATGVNPHFGTPKNPLDPGRIPGGSSSGSAVAVAADLADVAYGTDTAGSVRNPAACCGVVGLKTTWGRIPVGGTRPLAPSMDTIGPLARDVTGVVQGMALLEPGFSPVVIGRPEDLRLGRISLSGVDARIDAAVDAALNQSGCTVSDVEITGWEQAHRDGLVLMYAEALEVNRELWRQHRDRLGHDVVDRFERAEAISEDELAAVHDRRGVWQDELARRLATYDLLVSVGYPGFPPRLDGADPASNRAAVAVSFAGFPALCLPVPSVGGPPTLGGSPFPASLQLIAAPGGEELLVAVAGGLDDRLRGRID